MTHQRRRNRFEMSGAIFNQHLRVLKSSGAIAFELCNFLKIEWCNCTTCTPLTPPLSKQKELLGRLVWVNRTNEQKGCKRKWRN